MMKKVQILVGVFTGCLIVLSCNRGERSLETASARAWAEDRKPPGQRAPQSASIEVKKAPVPQSGKDTQRDDLEQLKLKREQLLVSFLDTSPRPGLELPKQAVAAFTKEGLRVKQATVYIRRPGCILNVEQGGRSFQSKLEGLDNCRLIEQREGGAPMVWEFSKEKLHGVLIADIRANDNNPRCTTKIKTLNLSQDIPRLSRDTASDQMCGFQGCDYNLFEGILEHEIAMQPVTR